MKYLALLYLPLALAACVEPHYTTLQCTSDIQCADGISETEDTCVEGMCHYLSVQKRAADFDPSTPERQDGTFICEEPRGGMLEIAEDQQHVELYWTERCLNQQRWAVPWEEPGYPFAIHFWHVGDVSGFTVHPELRVGEYTDTFRAEVRYDSLLGRGPGFDLGTFTAADLEEQGITIPVPVDFEELWGADDLLAAVRFVPVGEIHARTIQWALREGSVQVAATGEDVHTTFTIGKFMDVPEHGFLEIAEGPGGAVECLGEVLRPDYPSSAEWPLPTGALVREMSSPEILYVPGFPDNQRIYSFEGLVGFTDWFPPHQACAIVSVVPDGMIRAAHLERVRLGVRPGRNVSWMDPVTFERHQGMADRNHIVRDFGTHFDRPPPAFCSSYPVFFGDELDICSAPIDEYVGAYTIVVTDPADISQETLDGYVEIAPVSYF